VKFVICGHRHFQYNDFQEIYLGNKNRGIVSEHLPQDLHIAFSSQRQEEVLARPVKILVLQHSQGTVWISACKYHGVSVREHMKTVGNRDETHDSGLRCQTVNHHDSTILWCQSCRVRLNYLQQRISKAYSMPGQEIH